jgi:membrane protease YdiL (CAAX protease family)
MFRGLVFRHLRPGRTFWRAATVSVLFFAGAHVPLLLVHDTVIGIATILLALPTGYLTAYLYEDGRNTIWGCALFHTVNNGIPFVVMINPDIQLVAASLYILVGMVTAGGFVVWAFRSGRLSGEPRYIPAQDTAG